MKHATIIICISLLLSCSNTKKAIVQSEKKIITTEGSTPKDVIIPQEEVSEIDTITEIVDTKEISESIPKSTIEIENLDAFDHTSFNVLLSKYVTNDGNVNYIGFKNEWEKLSLYLNLLSDNMPEDSWRKEDILAYWINAYNAMTIDLILRHYPIKSIKDIQKPWEQRLWKLGNKWYNLDEIEHQILRKMDEPRIHFAIVCASFSCPKLLNEVFVASKLEQQLTIVTKAFLSDSNRNEISENSLKISKIFQWFSKDFRSEGSIIDFIDKYSDLDLSPNAKISFKDYNWDLND